ncbi:MAG: nucleoside triphosphate pyrophosphohydrolase [Erysipelotrichales bacterium]|nr:nucleoside triphosphate pyrophosphohydrolase [Erysipelotrichales bacterium]
MNSIIYNKLVRDKIPDIIERSGKIAITEILSDEQYIKMLDKKLIEELDEYQNSKDVEELADLLEVIFTIVEAKGIHIMEFEQIRKDKEDKRGGFKQKILLKEVVDK